jgi:leucine dehydrogenase
MQSLEIEKLPALDDYKLVVRFSHKPTKLKGFIAIHNENLGHAVGGTRMFPYQSEQVALIDALRLARSMTYKCAIAGVPFGGGKAVIIGDPQKDKTKELIKAYAHVINELKGEFRTGEDVGISEADVQLMLTESKFFIGKSGVAGDPSPYAALSTFYAIQVAIAEHLGKKSLRGLSIAIKGIGKVGGELARLAYKDGARVIVADTRPEAVAALKKELPKIEIVPTSSIHTQAVDVFSPCALGNDITVDNQSAIQAKIICGGANNQLSQPDLGDILYERGVLFIPDYVANAGGLINVVEELMPSGYSRKHVLDSIEHMKKVLTTILLLARQKHKAPSRVADQLAEEIFKNGHKRTSTRT